MSHQQTLTTTTPITGTANTTTTEEYDNAMLFDQDIAIKLLKKFPSLITPSSSNNHDIIHLAIDFCVVLFTPKKETRKKSPNTNNTNPTSISLSIPTIPISYSFMRYLIHPYLSGKASRKAKFKQLLIPFLQYNDDNVKFFFDTLRQIIHSTPVVDVPYFNIFEVLRYLNLYNNNEEFDVKPYVESHLTSLLQHKQQEQQELQQEDQSQQQEHQEKHEKSPQ